MPAPLVWFNKYLNNTYDVLALLRRHRRRGEFRILCTHPRPNYPGRRHADHFEREPDGLGDRAYVDYCLDVARRHKVTLFFPGRKRLAIVRAAGRFAELGTRVLAAGDAKTLSLLNHKARMHGTLAGDGYHLPEFAVVNDLAGFDAAWKRLRPRHQLLCYKPAVGVYGLGFKIVADAEPALSRLAAGDPDCITLDAARRALASKGRFPDLKVMQWLPGPEHSVDCLARDGELLRCVVRRKELGAQVIEDYPALVAIVRRLTARFRLSNLFNVQFRDANGEPHLLEINTRMSGGLPFACRAGLDLPLWAVRLALGTATPDDIPQPRSGIRVLQPQPVPST